MTKEIYAFFDSSMFNLTLFLRNGIFIYTQTVTENNTESQLKTPEISNIWHNLKRRYSIWAFLST